MWIVPKYLMRPLNRENLPGHFKFKEYCPRVFHDLRKRFSVDDSDFMVSKIFVLIHP